jgi:RNA polymerase sigma factor (sigma-70 family)
VTTEAIFSDFYSATMHIAAIRSSQIARLYRLPKDACCDLEQEALLGVWEKAHLFDERRAGWSTFADRVIANHLRSLLRRDRARRRSRSRDQPLDQRKHTFPARDRKIELRLDVGRVLASLSAFDRKVALSLTQHSATEAGIRLGIARSNVYRSIERIRAALVKAGY